MFVDVCFRDLFDSIHDEEKKKLLQEQRLEKIKWEYGLYNSFCRLYGLQKNNFESLVEFNNYCLESEIKLL